MPLQGATLGTGAGTGTRAHNLGDLPAAQTGQGGVLLAVRGTQTKGATAAGQLGLGAQQGVGQRAGTGNGAAGSDRDQPELLATEPNAAAAAAAAAGGMPQQQVGGCSCASRCI